MSDRFREKCPIPSDSDSGLESITSLKITSANSHYLLRAVRGVLLRCANVTRTIVSCD